MILANALVMIKDINCKIRWVGIQIFLLHSFGTLQQFFKCCPPKYSNVRGEGRVPDCLRVDPDLFWEDSIDALICFQLLKKLFS